MEATVNNRRIAKNTLMLYIRMIVIMLVTLYTSRVVLQQLGVEDFGIYNIVAGIVVLFSFINSAMTASTQRFLNFELGRGNIDEAQKIFAASLNIYIAIVITFIILAETVGLWFLNTYINIPVERAAAANWVYQATIIATALNFIRTPYNAAIIAYEQMSFYAYTSIIEAILKLGVVFIISMFHDKLIGYSWLLALIALAILALYVFFCRHAFSICRNHTFNYNKRRYTSLISFSGWSLFGSVANIGASQGINVLLNIFFGVAVNAAVGIANQVNGAVYQFVSNFQTAFSPQIVKTYAAGYKDAFLSLLNNAARYSFLLLFVISFPIYMECDFILSIWLFEVPPLAVQFTQLVLLANMFDALSGPLWCAVQATGKIKTYQLVVSLMFLSTLPLSYVGLKIGLPASYVFGIKVIISAILFIYRLLYIGENLNMRLHPFVYNVISRIALILILSIAAAFLLQYASLHKLLNIAIYLIIASSLSILIGLTKNERRKLILAARRFISFQHSNSNKL